jgi:arylsulfatase A-like enzyme
MTTIQRIAVVALLSGGLLANASTGRAEDRPPNFVFLYADDAGYGDLGCYGNTQIKTTNLDRMAAEGMRFTNFYSCAPICTPSRAGLLTGRYPIRNGLNRVLNPESKDGIDASEITLAEALKKRGYATACIGKWHLGHLPEYLPTRHGFDRYFGLPYSNDMTPCPLLRDEKTIEEPVELSTLTQRYTAEALQFIADCKDKPFFLYVPYTMPHVPLAASAKFKGKSAGGLYGDVLEELDSSVGEILAALKRYDLDSRTLVVFSSDNGPWLAKAPDAGSTGPLRDGKFSTFEGGIRMPCLARWPGKIKAGRVEGPPAIMLDWFPTFLHLAGGSLPDDRVIDGKDLSGVLLGTGKRADEEFFFYYHDELQAHRSGPWKLKLPLAGDKGHPLLLFNLDDDPGEKTNMADKHPEIVQRLQTRIAEFQKQLGTVPRTKR